MKYLFIGAHPDDLELCCGGTIIKLIRQGHETCVLTLSRVFNGNDLINEWSASTGSFAPRFDNRAIHDFIPRMFNDNRQKILDTLVSIGGDNTFDFIFTHSANDTHQDHKVVGEESLRAFKKQNLITYIGEWNQLTSESNYYIEVSEENMAKKLEAMACYKSQQHRPYFEKQFTYSRALLNGAKIGVKYAESFRIVNLKG